MRCSRIWICTCLSLAASPAVADPPQNAPAPASESEAPAERAPDEPDIDAMSSRIDQLENKLRLAEQSRKSRFPIKITGYGDAGFFATQGDGSGFRRDAGHLIFPDKSMYGWVFYGDLLATQVNSRGDVADLGDAPGVRRFDSVHSAGSPSFLINELALGISAGLGSQALFTANVNFTPRTGTDFSLGDSFDVDIAQLEWMPTENGKTSIFVGKVDSVLGIEYKTRKAPDRFGITPTLLARYTTGTAVGLKARTKLFDDHIIIAAAVTNGSFGTEQFHFYREVDTNAFKTLSARVALRWPVGQGHLELGPSGQFGTQDGAPDGAGTMWFGGMDAELDLGRIDIKAQYLVGHAPGDPVSLAYGLELKHGAYVETDFIVTPMLGILGRAELRDAEVNEGMMRLYITKNWRAIGGVRLQFNPNVIVKAEYSHNGEYGGVPSIPDDVVTTSAIFAF